MGESKKVAVLHQGFIPIYRVKFFQLLNEKSDNQYVVFHGSPPSNTGHREFDGVLNFPNITVNNLEFPFLGRTLIYQPILKTILFGSYDAVVLGLELKFICNIPLFFLCKVLGKPVVWWGHGFEREEESSLKSPFLSRILVTARAKFANLADMFIVYTNKGAERLKQLGLPKEKLAVVMNTLDMEEQCLLQKKLMNADPLEIRKKYNLKPDSVVLLYVGRAYKEKRIEEVLHLVKRINSEEVCTSFVEAVVVGSGPELDRLKEEGENIPGVHFLGEIYDQEVVAQLMRIATAMVVPGKVGLVVNHAFAHGLPTITRNSALHAPEVEYIKPGVNGLIIDGDFDEFLSKVVDYINSHDQQKKMSEAALMTRSTLTLDFMVQSFDNAVIRAIGGQTLSGK